MRARSFFKNLFGQKSLFLFGQPLLLFALPLCPLLFFYGFGMSHIQVMLKAIV